MTLPFRARWLAIAGLGLLGLGGDRPDPAPPAAPPGFGVRTIEGWSVFARRELLDGADARGPEVLELLRVQLYLVARRVPAPALAKLRAVRIWVERDEPHHECMAYHPEAAWLVEAGMDPSKARCVELANVDRFLKWTIEQPYMLLHELAHAYHHRFLEGGFENAEVRAAFDRATGAKRYEAVTDCRGKVVRGYAAKNPMEYFAEATEAFFGTNDFFPYVRPELRAHDPEMFDLLVKLWGDEASRAR